MPTVKSQLCPHIDMHRLDVRIRLQASLALFAADAKLFDAAKGDPVVRVVARVDPHHPGLDLPLHSMRPHQIPREHGCSEPVRRVVGLGRRGGFVPKGSDDKGPEDLIAVDAHVVRHLGDDSGGR